MDRGALSATTGGLGNAGWFGFLTIASVAGAVVLLFFGGWLSAIALLFLAFMAWSPTFRENQRQGKPTLGPVGRGAVGGVAATLAYVLFPGGFVTATGITVEPATSGPKTVAANETDAATVDEEKPSISTVDAISACEPEIKRRLAHPSTADFSWVTGSTRTSHGESSVLTVRLTAKNSFGLEIGMIGKCLLSGDQVIAASVEEDMG